jgi:hypothetical protein
LKFEPKTLKQKAAIPWQLHFTHESPQKAFTEYEKTSSLKTHWYEKEIALYKQDRSLIVS